MSADAGAPVAAGASVSADVHAHVAPAAAAALDPAPLPAVLRGLDKTNAQEVKLALRAMPTRWAAAMGDRFRGEVPDREPATLFGEDGDARAARLVELAYDADARVARSAAYAASGERHDAARFLAQLGAAAVLRDELAGVRDYSGKVTTATLGRRGLVSSAVSRRRRTPRPGRVLNPSTNRRTNPAPFVPAAADRRSARCVDRSPASARRARPPDGRCRRRPGLRRPGRAQRRPSRIVAMALVLEAGPEGVRRQLRARGGGVEVQERRREGAVPAIQAHAPRRHPARLPPGCRLLARARGRARGQPHVRHATSCGRRRRCGSVEGRGGDAAGV